MALDIEASLPISFSSCPLMMKGNFDIAVRCKRWR